VLIREKTESETKAKHLQPQKENQTMDLVKLISVLFSAAICASCMCAAPQNTAIGSAYAENAFPVAERAAVKARLEQQLAGARTRAAWTDQRLAQVFGVLPDDTFQKIRVSKRQLVRHRLFQFIERNLSRGDATGLGFAEQGIADAAVFEKIFANELECWANAPRKENNPVILNVKDFGARGDGAGDDSPAFLRACDAVRALGGRPSILRIPAGTYRMGKSYSPELFSDTRGECAFNKDLMRGQCIFENLENCSIEGESPANTFIRCGVYNASQVELLNCRNVSMKRLDISLEDTPFLEGTVEAFDPVTGACDVRLKPGSLTPDDPRWTPEGSEKFGTECFGFGFSKDGLLDPRARLLPWNSERKCEKLSDGKWRIFFNRAENPGAYDEFVKNIPVKGTLVLPNRCNYYGGVSMRYSSYCTFEDIWVRNSRSSGFWAHRSIMPSFYRCRVLPRDGFTLATNADGCMADPGAFLYQCSFDTMGDDGLNTLRYATVAEKYSSEFEVAHTDRGTSLGGDLAVFADQQTAQYLANRTLVQTDATIYFPDGWKRITRFTKPVPPECIGAFFYSPRQSGIGTVISNCVFRNGRLAGNVIQTSNVILENNRYFNLHEGVRIGALGDFQEGPPPYNVLVNKCDFQRLDVGLTCWLRMLNAEKNGWVTVKCAPIRAVEGISNTFFDISVIAVDVKNTGDSLFSGNTFQRVGKPYEFTTCENINCRQ